MTVVLTHLFKLLSFSINICCFYSFIFTLSQLMAKILFWKWQMYAILNFEENVEFGWNDYHLYWNSLLQTKFHQNRKVFIEIRRFNNFKMAAVRHLRFSKSAVFVTIFFQHAILLNLVKIAEIRRSLAELSSKTLFKMATVRHLEP